MSLVEDIYSLIFSIPITPKDFYKFYRISRGYVNIFWRKLSTIRCPGVDNNIIEFILHRVINLKILDLSHADFMTTDGFRYLPPTLRTCSIDCNHRITDKIFKYLPLTIKNLWLGQCYNITDFGLKNLPTTLQILTLTICQNFPDISLKYLPPTLKILTLLRCETFRDSVLDDLPVSLETLNLCWCCKITDHKIEEVSKKICVNIYENWDECVIKTTIE